MKKPMLCRMSGVLVGFVMISALMARAETALPRVDDAGLLRLDAPAQFRMPPRLMTPAMLARVRAGQPTLLTGYPGLFGNAGLGQRLAATIPENRWRELIPRYAGFTMRAGNRENAADSGRCPFCGQPYGGTIMTLEDFLAHPFQAKTACCGAIIYEHEADMPADYKARPNHVAKIPHLDGTTFDYHFYVPPGEEKEGPELGSRRNWFCSASEVWWARERFFQADLEDGAVAALAAALFEANDARAVRALAAIYDRLAEVYPGYPLVDNCGTANGLARSADGKHYLTREEYRATPVPCNDPPAWLRIPPYYNLGKMNHGAGWQDGVMFHTGNLAAIFDLIRDRPEVRAYSLEKYQDANAWEKKVRRGVLDELHFLGQVSAPTRGGNTSFEWFVGALRLGLVTQDPWFVQTAVGMLGPVIDNHYYADGLCVEGAFNYSAMIRPSINQVAVLRENLGLDLTPQHPLLPVIEARSDFPVVTLYGLESMHSDEHTYFFTGHGTGWKIPPAKVDYPAHETAQCDPIYGLACLRAGAPGSRLETIMDFQTTKGHTHDARLNLQMFYEGVNLLPDVGYACGAADVTRPPWSTVQYPFEKMPLPPGTDPWGAWYYTYAGKSEVHCTALVDGEHGAPERPGPVTFRRFLGGDKFGAPGYNAQFLEVDARGLFNLRPQPVAVFDRQLVAVTLAAGRPLTLDFFRIRGGHRHDLLWHAPARSPSDTLDTSLGQPAAMPGSLGNVLDQANPHRDKFWGPFITTTDQGADLIRRLGRWPMPTNAWQTTFHVEPAHFNPVTEGGRKFYQPWIDALHNVNLRLWGNALGSPATTQELLCARAPWPSKIREVIGGQEVQGLISLKDAFHVFDETRTATNGELQTTFVHVLEPFDPDQAPVVQKVEALAADHADEAALGAGVRVTLTSANTLLAATTVNGGEFTGGGLRLHGRLGVAEPAAYRLTLFDGTEFSVGGFGVDLEPGWDLRLLGVIGDLTGHPGESALIVQSRRPLPTDQTLVGRMLTVNHQISPYHATGYTIERVTGFGRHRYRIDLHNVPTFLIHRLTVQELDPQNPRRFKVNYWLAKGDCTKGLYDGRRVRFPRQHFETTMTLPPGLNAFHHAHVLLDRAPPHGIQVGEPVVIYQIQPGDRVLIPSHFACQGTATAAGLKLEITATGPATLTVPGGYRNAMLLMGFTQAPVARVGSNDGHLQVELHGEDLTDGRAILLLTR